MEKAFSGEQSKAITTIIEIIQRVGHQWSCANDEHLGKRKGWYLFTGVNSTSELAETIHTLKQHGVISDDMIFPGRTDESRYTEEFLLNPKYFTLK